MSQTPPDFFDTDGHPQSADASRAAERKFKVWAVLNAVDQGQLTAAEARAAYQVSAEEMEEHRAGWLALGAGSR